MGSITKPPVAPSAPQPVYYYVPSPPPPPPTNTGTDTPTDSGTPTPEQDKETRKQSLLRRDRGRLGTILSSFRGILGLSDNAQPRKTLLGE